MKSFKQGERVKIKSYVTQKLLGQIGIQGSLKNHSTKKITFKNYTTATDYAFDVGEKGGDVQVLVYSPIDGKNRTLYLPKAWIELESPRGHHLTNIFK